MCRNRVSCATPDNDQRARHLFLLRSPAQTVLVRTSNRSCESGGRHPVCQSRARRQDSRPFRSVTHTHTHAVASSSPALSRLLHTAQPLISNPGPRIGASLTPVEAGQSIYLVEDYHTFPSLLKPSPFTSLSKFPYREEDRSEIATQRQNRVLDISH